MKHILAEWHGHTVEIDSLSAFPGRVLVTTVDGTQPFTKTYFGSGYANDNSGCIFLDSLTNIRVITEQTNEAIARADVLIDELRDMLNIEADPFQPDDCQPEPEFEYDPADEWQHMTSELRRGEG